MGEIVASVYPCACVCVCVCARLYASAMCVSGCGSR